MWFKKSGSSRTSIDRSSRPRTGWRICQALGAAAMLAGAVLNPGQSAQADTPRDPRDPDARLQVIVKSIKILNDQDWGAGELKVTLDFFQIPEGCRDDTCLERLASIAPIEFSANDGETHVFKRTLPDSNVGAFNANPTIGRDIGIPVWLNQRYIMHLDVVEKDPIFEDYITSLVWHFPYQSGWDLGTRAEQGSRLSISAFGSVSWPDGDALVEYEIRKALLPDLRPTQIRVTKRASQAEDDTVCAPMQNAGSVIAQPFQVVFRLDGGTFPGSVLTDQPFLASGDVREICIKTKLPTSGQHKLSVTVDEGRLIPEENDLNNTVEINYTGTSAFTSAPSGTPTSALTIDSLEIKSRGATNDCDPGKNDVLLTLKNSGSNASAPTKASIQIGADASKRVSVPAIQAGASVTLRAQDLQFKKGTNVVNASVITDGSPNDAVTKSITVNC